MDGQLCDAERAHGHKRAAQATLISWKRKECASIRRCDTIA